MNENLENITYSVTSVCYIFIYKHQEIEDSPQASSEVISGLSRSDLSDDNGKAGGLHGIGSLPPEYQIVIWLEAGREERFRSVLELILPINSTLETTE